MAHIHLKDISLEFPIFNSHTRSLRTAAFARLGGQIAAHNRTIIVQALRNLSMSFVDGDRVALIGHNGAGKTTLLRVLAGVYRPQLGEVKIEGQVTSFTDLKLGMDTEETGWENIILRCAFMGLSFTEARALAPSIAEFSGLGEFLDMPVRTYSSGMFVRLAFAISTSIEPDIVIMDEMISSGDAQFIDKARKRIDDILGRTNIFVIASHDVGIVRQFCKTALWLERGRERAFGPVEEVMNEYLASPDK